MTDVIIHIGQHKTGSTTLQWAFNEALWEKRLVGVRYLNTKQPNHSFILSGAFGMRYPWHHRRLKDGLGLPRPDDAPQKRANLINVLRTALSSDIPILMIAEDLVAFHDQELEDLRDTLKEIGFDRIRITGYLRSVEHYVNSFGHQMVQEGIAIRRMLEAPPRPRYRERFEKFFRIFGEDNVTIRAFDAKGFKDGSLMADFVDMAGLPEILAKLPVRHLNETLSLSAMRCVAYLEDNEAMGPAASTANLYLYAAPADNPSGNRRFALPRDILKRAHDEAEDDILWAESRLGHRRQYLDATAPWAAWEEILGPPTDAELAEARTCIAATQHRNAASRAVRSGDLDTAWAEIQAALTLKPDHQQLREIERRIRVAASSESG